MHRDLRVLVTGGRFHPGTAVVRALRAAGARVDAADSYKLAPVLHSHAVEELYVVPSPSREPVRFAEAVAQIVREREIDLVVPVFEEGFYLARYSALIPVPLFAPPFETVAQLHNKFRFTELCASLGLRTPVTDIVTTQAELRETVRHFEHFVARPAFSRGGQVYLTNHGPRAVNPASTIVSRRRTIRGWFRSTWMATTLVPSVSFELARSWSTARTRHGRPGG